VNAVPAEQRARRPAADALPRVLAGAHVDGRALSLGEHLQLHGPLPLGSGDDLIGLVEASGLRGRGGAGFPTMMKLRAVAAARGRPVVVANGAEGEPRSGKDKVLLRHVPHLVLDGAEIAAAGIGAREIVVAVGAGAERELHAVRRAVGERVGGRRSAEFRVVAVPDGFVSGEETALVNRLNGGPAKPTSTPPRPYERGVGGAPTLVQNVETLANLALIARHGADWFRGVGTADAPGSALVSLGGAVAHPGVYEIPLGLPVEELLQTAGGATKPLSAFLIGGYFGSWVPADKALKMQLAGPELGAGVVVAHAAETCGAVESARIARYLANESAGQCGPCVHGLDAISGALETLASRAADVHGARRLEVWLRQVVGRGACRHPDGTARFVESALHVFAREFELHRRGRCTGHA
jgi:NADH:ubiquinone oxidoreductase subunit F (NADH-binding)